jgi:hypothetical protein
MRAICRPVSCGGSTGNRIQTTSAGLWCPSWRRPSLYFFSSGVLGALHFCAIWWRSRRIYTPHLSVRPRNSEVTEARPRCSYLSSISCSCLFVFAANATLEVRMTPFLILTRAAIIGWTTLAVLPLEIAYDVVERELERRGVEP